MTFQPGQSGNPKGRPVGSVNMQLRQLRQAADVVLPLMLARALGGDFEAQKFILERALPKLKPIDIPVEFELPEEGAGTPARAVLQQVAAGELSLSHAKEVMNGLLPVVQREEKAIERKEQPSGFMNAYLGSVMRG